MTKKKVKPDDPGQMRRALDLEKELEAAGELSPTDAGEAFERAFGKIVPERPRPLPKA
jgi:hypothetical protein